MTTPANIYTVFDKFLRYNYYELSILKSKIIKRIVDVNKEIQLCENVVYVIIIENCYYSECYKTVIIKSIRSMLNFYTALQFNGNVNT